MVGEIRGMDNKQNNDKILRMPMRSLYSIQQPAAIQNSLQTPLATTTQKSSKHYQVVPAPPLKST